VCLVATAPGSFVYRHILTPMNVYLIEFFPRWMAPNVITLLGLAAGLIAHACGMYYAMDMQTAMPAWVYCVTALGLFLYQTLDNLDGRQARRTNSSSPLGLLFDHGVDALNTTFSSLVRLGPLQANFE
jgi:ethanolaminephosphotransferase